MSPALADAIVYTYDELGRLKSVTDGTGQTAEYVYDDLGNITAIIRTAAGIPVITEFTPDSGAIGSTVSIFGSGFGPTPAANDVRFNGVPATVTSASTTRLVATVPAGAATGPITVTVGSNTATSATNFVVISPLGAPTIASFAPSSGVAGTLVTITGNNFDSSPGATKVEFNTVPATASSVTSTQLVAAVPSAASSGPIRILTPAGSATTTTDFIVPPASINLADILETKRAAIDGPAQTFDINVPNKVGLLLFDGTQGDTVSIHFPTLTTVPAGSVVLEVYSPKGVLQGTYTKSAASSIHLVPLSTTGTYAVFLKPGAATATITASVVRDPVLQVDGPASNQTLTFAGQSRRYVFDGRIGQYLGIGISNLLLTSGFSLSVTVYKPDGRNRQLSVGGTDGYVSLRCQGTGPTSGCTVAVPGLVETGRHLFTVSSASNAVGTFTAQISSVPSTTLVTDGATATVTTTRPGQPARFTFTALANQSLGLGLTGFPFSSVMYLIKPDGQQHPIQAQFEYSCAGCTLDLANLPLAGTYNLLAIPTGTPTGSFTGTLSTPLVAGSIATGGPALNVSTTRSGQIAHITTNVISGQFLSIGVTSLTNSGTVDIAAAGGGGCTPPGCTVVVGAASQASYTMRFIPSAGTTFSGTFSASTNMDAGPVVLDGAVKDVSVTRAGQQARMTFNATAGQDATLGVSGVTIPQADVAIYAPGMDPNDYFASVNHWSCNSTPGGCTVPITLPLGTLTVAGTYTINVTPLQGGTGTFSAVLSSPLPANMTVDGSSSTINVLRAGRPTVLSFSGTAGQNLGVGVQLPQYTADASIHRPDDAVMLETVCQQSSGCDFDLPNIPVTGSYKLRVTPQNGKTGQFTATASRDITGSLTPGKGFKLNISRFGQNARLTFSCNTNQLRTLTHSSLSTTPANTAVSFIVLGPDGSVIGQFFAQTPKGSQQFTCLLTGNHTLVVNPFAATASMTLTLSK